ANDLGTEEALTAEGREWENPVNMIQGNNEEAPTLMEGESLAITQPISPKTMTVHVQIHSNPVSTSPLISGKKSKKIASIFLKKKPDFDTNDVEAIPLSPNPTDPVPARRSNVVISEEELELSVLDVTEQSPIKAKCSRVEKEQFMNAFRQPSAELAKSGLKKALGKPKVLKASQDEGVEEVDACSSQEKDELASAESAHILARCSEESAVGKRNSKGQSVKRRNKLKCKRISHKIVKGNLKVDGYELIENGNDDLDGNSIDLKELGTKDPSTTQSNDSPKRLTRRSFRQQRNAVDYCSTPVSVASYLQLLCLAENMRTDAKDLSALLALNKSDIRRSMLHLQYWVRSGGARLPTADSQDNSDLRDEDVPLCDTGCAEQLLGLKTSSGPHQDLLLEFQRRRLDFMSCNLERLLPLPKQIIAEPREPADNADLTEPVLRGSGLMEKSQPQQHDRPADSRPPKAVTKTYQRRKVELFDSDLFDSELNLSNSFLTLPSEIPATGSDLDSADSNCLDSLSSGSSKNRLNCSHDGANKPRTLAEQKCCELVSVCLGSLVEFMDSASFLDSCLRSHSVETEGWCGRDRYHWSAAEVKSGMLDERRLEQGDWWVPHHFGEVRATVEAMSWKKCQSRMAQAIETSVPECRELGVDPTGELTLSISQAASHKDVMYSQHSHYHTSTAMKRVEVGKSVFTSKAFACLGNRQASAVEYLPVLRTICRAEKQKEQGKLKRRFLHYLDGIHLEIPKGTLERLAADFP
uniref:ATPase family AAA domain-containing protein 5 n=1 Tax=Callorhinchus milii TaxID=7868 RepID=A0A4W3K7W6_CALMI